MRIEMTALEETAHVLLGVLVESPEGSMRVHNHEDIGVLGFEATDIQRASGLSTKQLNSVVEYLIEAGALENRFPGHVAPGFVFRFVSVTDFGEFLYREYKYALGPQDLVALRILQRVQIQIEELDRIVACLQKERDWTRGRHRLERWKERTTELFEKDLTAAEAKRLSAVPSRTNVEDALTEYLSFMNIVVEEIRRRPDEMIASGRQLSAIATSDDESNPSSGSYDPQLQVASSETIPSDPAKVFVVHGRNERARDALFQFLRTIGLKPIEWSEAIRATGNPSPYVGEILDAAFSLAQAVVVLMTPDDMAYLREPLRGVKELPYEIEPTGQARPNVLFEAGMALGRHPRRTVLVELGDLRPFSDVAGRHAVRIDNTTQKRHDLADRLALAECPVDLTGRDWHTAGDFEAALEGL